MKLKHCVRVNVEDESGTADTVLQGGERKIRSRFLDKLLGKRIGVLILTPGKTVQRIEVVECQNDEKGEVD